MSAQEAVKVGNLCPKCGHRMTKGVDLRVEELADRPEGTVPKKGCTKFVHLLPLHEIISTVTGTAEPSARSVWNVYNWLVSKFSTEYNVMLNETEQDLAAESNPEVASAIIKVRGDLMRVAPGYDGVYGEISLEEFSRPPSTRPRKTKLDHYV